MDIRPLQRSLEQRKTRVYNQQIVSGDLTHLIRQELTGNTVGDYFRRRATSSLDGRYYIPNAKFSFFHHNNIPFNTHALNSPLNHLSSRIADGIHRSRVDFNAPGIVTAFGSEPANLLAIHYLWEGAGQEWVFAKGPEEKELIESFLRPAIDATHSCADAHRHRNRMIPPRILAPVFNKVVYCYSQRKGEFLITFDQSLVASYSLGYNTIETARFGDMVRHVRHAVIPMQPFCNCPNLPHHNLNW